MQDHSLESYEAWFAGHVTHYRLQAEGGTVQMVDLKECHTACVLKHMRSIIKESAVSEEMAFAMEIAALLHDVGRFPQVVNRETYDDAGYNHAEEGERIIREAGVLGSLSEPLRDVILGAVKLHNLGVLPGDLEPDVRLVTEALRDADKMDAVRNILRCLNPEEPQGKALKLGLKWDDNEVSPTVLDAAKKRQLIAFQSIKWSNDFVLFVCCWLYDLHYNYSYKHLKESGNYEQLLAHLPDTATFTELKAQLRDDLDWIEKRSR